MRPEPRPELLHMPDPIHGALDFAELDRLGLAPEAVLDFSVNGNPYGPSPYVREALAQVPYDRYPDREGSALRRVLATHLGVTVRSAPRWQWQYRARLARGAGVCAGWRHGIAGGAHVRRIHACGCPHGGPPAPVHRPVCRGFSRGRRRRSRRLLQQCQPRLVFLCNPNNPTGTFVAPDSIAHWAAAFPRTLFIVDEAYLTFTAVRPLSCRCGVPICWCCAP